MELEIRLFARARDLAGSDTVRIELPHGASVGDLRAALPEQVPELAPVVPQLLVAVGTDYAADSTVLDSSHSVSCFPPVSGG